jgi:hypothetical protein
MGGACGKRGTREIYEGLAGGKPVRMRPLGLTRQNCVYNIKIYRKEIILDGVDFINLAHEGQCHKMRRFLDSVRKH